jgi:hypothetical protein
MGLIHEEKSYAFKLRESANDGSDFTNPEADYRIVFLGEDGEWHSRDSSGTVAGFAGSGIASTIVAAKGDIIGASANDTPAITTVGTNGYGLLADSGASTGLSWHEILPWHVVIVPMLWTPDATTGTWASPASGSTDSGFLYPLYTPGSTANSGGAASTNNSSAVAQNDAIAYDVILAAGTWDFHCWVRKSTNTGIITLQQDGADMGTVDTYAAAAAAAKVSITGWSVSSTGKKRMNLKMATKNASSSNYVLTMFGIEFRRTA